MSLGSKSGTDTSTSFSLGEGPSHWLLRTLDCLLSTLEVESDFPETSIDPLLVLTLPLVCFELSVFEF